MKRRNFIILSSLGVAALGASYWYLMYSEEGYYNSLHYPDTLSSIWDTQTIMEIGMEYRNQVPNEDSEEFLFQSLSSQTSNTISNLKTFRALVRRDFELEKTMMIKGWIISITEARQCALFSIINSK